MYLFPYHQSGDFNEEIRKGKKNKVELYQKHHYPNYVVENGIPSRLEMLFFLNYIASP